MTGYVVLLDAAGNEVSNRVDVTMHVQEGGVTTYRPTEGDAIHLDAGMTAAYGLSLVLHDGPSLVDGQTVSFLYDLEAGE